MKCFLVLFTDVIKFEQSNVELDKIAFFQLSGLFFKDSEIKFNLLQVRTIICQELEDYKQSNLKIFLATCIEITVAVHSLLKKLGCVYKGKIIHV